LVSRLEGVGDEPEELLMIVTTPLFLNDLKESSPLARLVGEEMALWFVKKGYRVQEIRKSRNIIMVPEVGEIALTRDASELFASKAKTSLVMTGTYSVMSRQVVFHFRIIEASSNEILAMTKAVVDINQRTYDLLTRSEKRQCSGVMPTVRTSQPD
jgi:hypothetical protein